MFKCMAKDCHKQFSVKVGTIFEDSAVPLDKWLVAVWLVVNCKNGISSYEISRDLKVTQKSAWFMLHRIRLAMQQGITLAALVVNRGTLEDAFFAMTDTDAHAILAHPTTSEVAA